MKRWLGRIIAALGVVLVLLVVYGVLVEPRFILDEERADVPLPQLGQEDAGTTVAVVSDWQIGMWFDNDGMVEDAVETIVAADPDVVLLGGDFVYSSDPGVEVQVDRVLSLVEPLVESGVPTFAVLGNHDYAVGMADELTAALEGVGIPVLENEAVPVDGAAGGAAGLHVVGIGALRPGVADIDEALADVPDGAPRVVLAHNPSVFPDLPPGSAPLTVAGHTHCGQIAIPGLPGWSYIELTEQEEVVTEGWAPEDYGAEGNRMFVTCGIGFSLIPARINAPPQVAFFELQPGS
ncbi:metallophosphoesterase [Geodermatophilus sp. DF01-2]|uniref:metallophosphoesterase n=1 Tax=Geodermatophilus sp. DF01-2 TaxID=2559610 RepID=UPI0010742FC4|nr:metallophosphoesterase [Geodermatophilus sp. DF01_2]TFV57709.1 metallophosphoesterase [Geodermatophilus sp. DF01_2]